MKNNNFWKSTVENELPKTGYFLGITEQNLRIPQVFSFVNNKLIIWNLWYGELREAEVTTEDTIPLFWHELPSLSIENEGGFDGLPNIIYENMLSYLQSSWGNESGYLHLSKNYVILSLSKHLEVIENLQKGWNPRSILEVILHDTTGEENDLRLIVGTKKFKRYLRSHLKYTTLDRNTYKC